MVTPFFDDYSWPAVLRNAMRTAATGAQVMTNGNTVFTIVGGPIMIHTLVSECITANGAGATTLQWNSDGDVSAAATFTGATASLASAIVGTMAVCNFTALTTAPDLTTTGVALGPVLARTGILVPAGIITMVIATGPTTGTWAHYLRYSPLGRNVNVAPAF